MKYPNFREEKKLWQKGYKRVACLDESGRGSLCGPVVAAAVMTKPCLKWQFKHLQLKDSKKLIPQKREEFYNILTKNPNIEWAIGRVLERVIDRINILEATKLAMKKAIKNLEKKLKTKFSTPPNVHSSGDRVFGGQREFVNFLILDGNFKIDLLIPQKSIVKADEKVFSCAMASIIAKVNRDRIMRRYHKKYPRYRFDKHKGYPTEYHIKMLKKYGPCKIHRKSFKPVQKVL